MSSQRTNAMFFSKSRVASLLVYAILLLVALAVTGGRDDGVAAFAIALLFPLVLIWMPERLGNYIGRTGSGYINHQTPPIFVAIAGWCFLIGMPVFFYWLWLHSGPNR